MLLHYLSLLPFVLCVWLYTAFVGFGDAFGGMTANTSEARGAKYACKLGSKLTGDSCSPDATNTALRNPTGGFGNGGFYYVTSNTEVTQSIAKFIKDNQIAAFRKRNLIDVDNVPISFENFILEGLF